MGTPLLRFGPPKLDRMRGIKEILPRMPQTLERRNLKIEPVCSWIWEGNQREKNHEGFMHTSPTKYQRERSQNSHKEFAEKGIPNHQKGETRKTHTSLEKPH
jgi:hypothetical protein